MKKPFLPILIPALAGALAFQACSPDPVVSSAPEDTLVIYTDNYPLQYFTEWIGLDHVEVRFPAPPEVDPAEWHPEDEVIAAYQQADLIVLTGAGYAHWTEHAVLPEERILISSASFSDQWIVLPDTITHTHGPEGTHTHDGYAFTVWLDPLFAIAQAAAIRDALSELRPDAWNQFNERFEALARELEKLHQEMETMVQKAPERPLLASHPVYQYLEARYSLHLESVHWEPDEYPEEEEWFALDQLIEQHPAQWMLWEDTPLPGIEQSLLDRGITPIVFNPTAQAIEGMDFLESMRQNVRNLSHAFEVDVEP